ncbi:uncharacterized protein J3D65DRAFT_669194 [Phyllosticta citribraziliensis]|uniref:Uncharacterized protein n=1 Tax=Phyllosticta citribraziliensis TaxID=989973 RepID=A0ABR1LIQ6_9PEZI
MDSSTLESPFCIAPEDLQSLQRSESFQILRKHLALNASKSFCSEHAACSSQAQSTWTLHRDFLHALVYPVVQLFHRASTLAEAALCSSKPEDLEMAYTGDARSGFLWLQCFIADEEAWCHSIGCPACVVTTSLSTEPHLRMIFTALNLAATKPSPCMPSFSFFASVLRTALETDPFWAPYYGTTSSIEASAEKLTSHIHALVSQCAEIEALVTDYRDSVEAASTSSSTTSSVQSSRPSFKTARTAPASPLIQCPGAPNCGKLPAVKPSRLARRQQRMRVEEQVLLQKLVLQCWGKAALTGAIPGGRDRAYVRAAAQQQATENARGSAQSPDGLEKRRRSLTCPN